MIHLESRGSICTPCVLVIFDIAVEVSSMKAKDAVQGDLSTESIILYIFTLQGEHINVQRFDSHDRLIKCYSYSQPRGTIIGSLFGTLLMILGIGLLAYFCCLRRRRKQSSPMPDEVFSVPSQPPPPPNFVTVGGYAPALDPNVPTYPVPVSKSNAYPLFATGPSA
ncbi:unnamed protein product [Hydatigera taeniaeformis]|uniref:Uncharacterized protein n=1 Tax=Hydatigena taeniaeformis TaxID=6205 RepID=A0A3P7FYL4_HYDTA|nr:unnamed protein product [Hydatigera taeniaeformis]